MIIKNQLNKLSSALIAIEIKFEDNKRAILIRPRLKERSLKNK